MSEEPEGGTVETGGPRDRLLRWDRVRDVTGLSRSTAWRLQRAGDFPKPVRISPNRVGWWESELTAWKASRAVGGLPHPGSLQRPRAPKLIHTVRSPRKAEPPEPPRASTQTPGPRPVRRGRARSVCAGQIDFGF